MNLNSLPIVSVLSDHVTIVQKDDVKIVRVQHPKAEAGISLFGGHVVSFKPQDQEDVIWMSQQAVFDGKTALRGGIPVCWPWFGRIATPAHGFARSTQWTLVEHKENEQGVMIRLGMKPSEASLAIWPHQFEALLDIEISDTLNVSLKVKNTDTIEWAFSGALHSYFNIADILYTEITGMGDHYLDSLKDGKVSLGGETLTFSSGVDRVYTHPKSEIKISDPKNHRFITVENQGSNAAVIWNPWELASSMADMEDDGYQTMVCVESTLHAPSIEEGKVLQPQESYTLSTKIGVIAS
ncbi:D-hexose-6-phosphate mutarotase [Vibrio rumoiensis]|uniref:Putative glucose-6-phosphate 1-epimerase n=1 Tax=Vibrio rumoiensis 1S-45 TaxID=1188252 RepID=A0A1E5E543_9VIBR|nr:D-hexose-6-phosphate mutarotase [Vibrio rumoiensis]OEF27680.1 D-hexose-6-phosphate mutarotase [Vibrio rumoiensis 1S-45]